MLYYDFLVLPSAYVVYKRIVYFNDDSLTLQGIPTVRKGNVNLFSFFYIRKQIFYPTFFKQI